MKATLNILGVTLELEAKSDKELWQKIAFYQSLPTTCPIDGSPTRFGFRSPEGNDYYEIANTNPLYSITFHIGQNKEGGTLYTDGTWSWWDWKNKEKIILAKWTTLTDEGEQLREQILENKPARPKAAKPKPVAQPTQKGKVESKEDKPDKALVALRKTFHALGMALSEETIAADPDEYSEYTATGLWEERRSEIVDSIGKGRKPRVQLESSNELYTEEMYKIIRIMEGKAREKVYEWIDYLGIDAAQVSNLLPEGVDLSQMEGVALANLLKTVVTMNITVEDSEELPY